MDFVLNHTFQKESFLLCTTNDYVVEAYKVTIPANAFPYHINENGDFEICIPSAENK